MARGLLSSDGHQLTQTTLERVSESLHAVALDPDARDQVRDGCLARELRHVGLGDSGAVSRPAAPRRGPTPAQAHPKAEPAEPPRVALGLAGGSERRAEQAQAQV